MGYGQSGSGKSFTMSGLRNNWEVRLCRIFCIFDFKELVTKTILLEVHEFLHNFKYDEFKRKKLKILEYSFYFPKKRNLDENRFCYEFINCANIVMTFVFSAQRPGHSTSVPNVRWESKQNGSQQDRVQCQLCRVVRERGERFTGLWHG